MYIKIHTKYDNKGSCSDLIDYLEKENEGKEIGEEEFFFSQDADAVNAVYARAMIDGNHSKLGKQDSKFFMLTINPSAEEIAYLSGSKEDMKGYTRAVMEEYARQFDRELDGRKMDGSDLLWFAKVEERRNYAPGDPKHYASYQVNTEISRQVRALRQELSGTEEVAERERLQKGIGALEKEYVRDSNGTVILPHKEKDGLNLHVHVIVSRKDRSGRLKLSPLSNSKGSRNRLNGREVGIGFNRKEFVERCEGIFDKRFLYERDISRTFRYYHARKHDAREYMRYCHLLSCLDPRHMARQVILGYLSKDPILRKLIYFPRNTAAVTKRIQDTAIREASKWLVAHYSGGPPGWAGKIPATPHYLVQKALQITVDKIRMYMTGIEI